MTRLNQDDPARYFLGSVCGRGHGENGKNRRYKSNGGCVQCLHDKINTETHKEDRRQYLATKGQRASIRQRNQRFNHSIEGKLWRQNYRKSARGREVLRRAFDKYKTSEHGKQRRKAYWLTEAGRQTTLKHRQTEKFKEQNRCKEHRRRARKLQVHNYPWTPEQWQERLAQFNHRCAYCDRQSAIKLTVDHFVPLVQGGPDCLGNIIPACLPCNRSKQAREPAVWYREQPFYSLKRWQKILKVLGLSAHSVGQLPLF